MQPRGPSLDATKRVGFFRRSGLWGTKLMTRRFFRVAAPSQIAFWPFLGTNAKTWKNPRVSKPSACFSSFLRFQLHPKSAKKRKNPGCQPSGSLWDSVLFGALVLGGSRDCSEASCKREELCRMRPSQRKTSNPFASLKFVSDTKGVKD